MHEKKYDLWGWDMSNENGTVEKTRQKATENDSVDEHNIIESGGMQIISNA